MTLRLKIYLLWFALAAFLWLFTANTLAASTNTMSLASIIVTANYSP